MHDDAHDVQLLLSFHNGDQDAFWTLWIRHTPRLRAVCLREMRGNRVNAEDALHEAMLRARERLPRFAAHITSPASWLSRLTSNVCKDIYREHARGTLVAERLKILESDRVQPAEVPEGDRPADIDDPSALVALLPDHLRDVFALRVLERATYREIATRLGVTSATARKRVQQSRETLREWRRLQVA
jgi:RNA polymerase sigma-70 factor (ECF subfamily)